MYSCQWFQLGCVLGCQENWVPILPLPTTRCKTLGKPHLDCSSFEITRKSLTLKYVLWGHSKWAFTVPEEESIFVTTAIKKIYVVERPYIQVMRHSQKLEHITDCERYGGILVYWQLLSVLVSWKYFSYGETISHTFQQFSSVDDYIISTEKSDWGGQSFIFLIKAKLHSLSF